MRSLLRSLFVWLMAFALPLQGIAAVGMQACGPMHERAGPVAAATDDAVHGHGQVLAHHVHAAQLSHSAHSTSNGNEHLVAADLSPSGQDVSAAADLSASDQDIPAAVAQVPAGQEFPAAGHQCGACAACCTAAALPSSVAFATASGAGVDVILPAPERIASFVPPGLERPPRTLLA
jgi:hypothetical protein